MPLETDAKWANCTTLTNVIVYYTELVEGFNICGDFQELKVRPLFMVDVSLDNLKNSSVVE